MVGMIRGTLRHLTGRDDPSAPADPWSSVDLSHTFGSGVTVRVKNLSDWWVFNEVFVDLDYDPAIDFLVDRTEVGVEPLILDLGANVGFFAARVIDRLFASEIEASLVMVEGSPAVYEDLESRLDSMRSQSVTLTTVNGLIGERSGHATISEVDFGARNTLHPEHNAGIKPVSDMTRHEVPFVDLAGVIAESKRISLLKCDIEGSEQSFLENYAVDLLPRTDLAVFELHRTLCDVPKCLQILSEAGLRVVSSIDQQDDTSLTLLVRDGSPG
jgi:FkbM family methyltransferase